MRKAFWDNNGTDQWVLVVPGEDVTGWVMPSKDGENFIWFVYRHLDHETLSVGQTETFNSARHSAEKFIDRLLGEGEELPNDFFTSKLGRDLIINGRAGLKNIYIEEV